MSNSIYSLYKRTLVSNYGTLYHPNWHPTTRHELGDYGTLLNGQLVRMGNIRDMGIRLIASKPRVTAHQTFSSNTGVSYQFDTGGQTQLRAAPSAKVKLKVSFSGGQGVSIQAYGIHHIQIQNYQEVMTSVLQRYSIRRWDAKWVVVTELHQAKKCLMAISSEGAQEAEIEFEAEQKVPLAEVTMANANLGLVCKSHRNIGYTLDTQQGEVTLGLSYGKVHIPLMRRPRVQPFENKGRWGSDGPTTQWVQAGSTSAAVPVADMVETGAPQFVQVQVSI
jgi:hypothetical protein